MNTRGGRPESVLGTEVPEYSKPLRPFISFGLALGISLSAMWGQVKYAHCM